MQWRINQVLLPYHPTSISSQVQNGSSTQSSLLGITSATLTTFDTNKSIDLRIYDKPTKVPSSIYTLPSQNLFKSIEYNSILDNYLLLNNTNNNVEVRNNSFVVTSSFTSPVVSSLIPTVAKKNGIDVVMLYKTPTQASVVRTDDTGALRAEFTMAQPNDEFVDLTTTSGLDYTYVLDSYGRIVQVNASSSLGVGQSQAIIVAQYYLDDYFTNKDSNIKKYKGICSFIRDGYYYLAIYTDIEIIVVDILGNVITSFKKTLPTKGIAFNKNTSEILLLTDKYIYKSKLNMADIILNNVLSELTQAEVVITDENGIERRYYINDFDITRSNNLGNNMYTVSINYRL
jgi:hypothetical protein